MVDKKFDSPTSQIEGEGTTRAEWDHYFELNYIQSNFLRMKMSINILFEKIHLLIFPRTNFIG